MPDVADIAQGDIEELERIRELQRQAKAGTEGRLQPKGACYNCGEPLEILGALFCDKDCRHDYEGRERERRERRSRF